MKKVILIMLFIVATIGAKAQNATGNASDHGVPVPVSTPQLNPLIGVSSVNTPVLIVPTAPPVQVLSPPLVTPTPTITGAGMLPAVPLAPTPPLAPAPGTLPSFAGAFSTTLNLPVVPMLPPIAPIPPMPDVRLPIGSK